MTQPAPLRVLLLGDAVARPDGLERELARAGFRVTESDDPRAEPDSGTAPDVVLVTAGEADASLADMLEAVAYAFGPAMPRVVTLSGADREGPARALALGAADAVLAPVHLPELCARLELRRRPAAAPAARSGPVSTLDASFDLAYDIAGSIRAEEILHQLCRRVARALDLARCSFVLTPPDSGEGRVVADFEHPGAGDVALDLARYPEIAEARRTGEPVVVADVRSDPLFDETRRRWTAQPPQAELRSVVALPVSVGGTVRGVFLLRPRDARVRLAPAQVAFAGSLAKAAARALAIAERGLEVPPATDALTGCCTPEVLEERMAAEFERARRYSLGFSVLLVDVDALRQYNERLGEQGGDRVLADLGGLFRHTLRVPDLVCRYGGDEFAMVLPETGIDGARTSVQRIRSQLRGHDFGGLEPPDRPTISVGIVSFPHPSAERAGDLLALAEAALLRAKGQTGERIGIAEYTGGNGASRN